MNAIDPPPIPADLAASPPEPARPCPRCEFITAALPSAARFCPRCGMNLAESAPEPPTVNWSEWDRLLANFWTRPDRPVILKGYARALSRLGWQYEIGHRVQRNYDEALRCYTKAAQLGDDYAQERLRAISARQPGEAG